MYLLAPANSKEVAERLSWFRKPSALELSKKGIKFGLEIKEPLSYLKKAPDCYFGIHLPYEFATKWYYQPKRRKVMLKQVKKLGKLKPNYLVLHGIRIAFEPPARDYVHRYVATASGNEYLKLVRGYIKLVKELNKIAPVKIENLPLTTPYFKDGKYLPYTHLYSGTNRLNDLNYIKQKTGAGIILDTEHLATVLNFLNRQKNYQGLPVEKIEKPTLEDKHAQKIFGFYLKKYFIPYTDKKIKLEDFIKKLKAKHYHVTGSFQDVIPGKRIASHGPISQDNKTFCQVLHMILAQKPEAMLFETANSTIGKTWKHLRKNETEISFDNLCRILLEEL